MGSFHEYFNTEINLIKERMNYLESLIENLSKSISASQKLPTVHVSPEKNSEMSLKNSKASSKKEDAWSKAVNYLSQNKINEAFSCILAKNDDLLLIRLMGRTGIILKNLDQANCEYLLSRIIDMIGNQDFVNFLLPWTISYVDSKIQLSLHLQSSLSEALRSLLDEKNQSQKLDNNQILEINRVLVNLKDNLEYFYQ